MTAEPSWRVNKEECAGALVRAGAKVCTSLSCAHAGAQATAHASNNSSAGLR